MYTPWTSLNMANNLSTEFHSMKSFAIVFSIITLICKVNLKYEKIMKIFIVF